MKNYICTTCGVQQAATATKPERCPICEDDRQYIHPDGQNWTTLDEMRPRHRNVLREVEPRLTGIVTEPKFAIGQRPLLVQTPHGNVLWDCMSLIDEATVDALNALGGISAIAISHPHFYDSMIEWSRAFGDVPIYLHATDREWVMRPDPVIIFWEENTHRLNDDVTLIRCGGHFPGSTVLHWAKGADNKGVLLTSDTIMVVADKRFVTFMYSYPNSVPLNAVTVQGIVDAVQPFAFDRIYGGWWESVVLSDAKGAVRRSAERYIRHVANSA
ncbi:MBL fold metallo-hydrolase [Chloroflexi bacterium TSY]|nr:MBL fold metallo-hydrolase [Chloroflexi bacterium TSY]